MNIMLKVILAVYHFFVGDLVILLGVTLIIVTLALIDSLDDEQRGLTHDMLSPRVDCTFTRCASQGLRPHVLAGAWGLCSAK